MAMPGSEADALQMQAMQHMLSGMSGMAGGMPTMPPSVEAGGAMPGMPMMPQVDPAMAAQAYMQMIQYFQGAAAQQTALTGLPPSPVPPMFPGMPAPYAPTAAASDPAIAVSVEGMKFQYQLTEDDLHKVFSRYGSVKQIRVDEAGASAVISFQQFHDAQAAMNDLNGKVLNGLEGTLRITWLSQGGGAPGGAFPAPPYPSMPFPNPWGFPPNVSQALPAAVPGVAPAAPMGGGLAAAGGEKSPHTKGVRKYTCRFLIGIENDKEFQVARRIIGAKGANMKRVVKMSEAKLRLRGVGSGYFEGAGQKESMEPLQLCISCTSTEGYRTAVQQVEELLKRVYEEYKQFCHDAGKPVPDLQINLSENQLVYSSRSAGPAGGAGGPMGGLGGGPMGGAPGADLDGSPKKTSRGRRSRGKDVRTASGELDRGEPGPNAPPVEEIEKLIDDRNEARRANNFPEADRIRELLHKRGVALMDEPGGRGKGAEVTTWRYWRD